MSTDNETIEAYRKRHQDYLELTASGDDFRKLNRFIKLLPPDARVYDIGAGPGHDAAQMHAAGLSVVALEPTEEFAAIIEEKGIPVQRYSFAEIHEKDHYDGAWASFSLLHAAKADLPRYLGQIATALKTEGIFVIAMKSGDGEARDHLGRFYSYYHPQELESLLEDAGFSPFDRQEGFAKGLAGTRDPWVMIWSRKLAPGGSSPT